MFTKGPAYAEERRRGRWEASAGTTIGARGDGGKAIGGVALRAERTIVVRDELEARAAWEA